MVSWYCEVLKTLGLYITEFWNCKWTLFCMLITDAVTDMYGWFQVIWLIFHRQSLCFSVHISQVPSFSDYYATRIKRWLYGLNIYCLNLFLADSSVVVICLSLYLIFLVLLFLICVTFPGIKSAILLMSTCHSLLHEMDIFQFL